MSMTINESRPPDHETWLPYWEWEECTRNMWGSVSHRKTWVSMAAEFTGNAELYGEWMRKVVERWPNSCAHNLSKSGDKHPWIGHAAVALAIACPEDIVREAWAMLNDEQQRLANIKASEAIDYWKESNAKKVS